MAANDHSEGPPDKANSPPGTSGTILTNELHTTLNNLNESMGNMARILDLTYKEKCPPGNDVKRAAPEGDSAAHERRRKVARTESGDENSADEDDKVSLMASDNLEDDIEDLVSPIPAPSS